MPHDEITDTSQTVAAGQRHTPGPWSVGYHGTSVECVNERIGGPAKLFDVRGWGYLTGSGHGALSLAAEDAQAVQSANAHLAAAAPELLAALHLLVAFTERQTASWPDQPQSLTHARAAIAKAKGAPASTST